MNYKDISYKGTANPAYEYSVVKNRFVLFINFIICHICKILPLDMKNSLYRLIGVKIGKNVVIAPYVQIDPFFPELIVIDDNVIIGWGASIFTHEFSQEKTRKGKVHIKKRALIGGFSIIRSGVTVGEQGVVAANSFVINDVLDYETVGGNPAARVRIS